MRPGRGDLAGSAEEGHAVGGGFLLRLLQLLLGPQLLVDDDLDVVLRKGKEEETMSQM